MNHYIALLFVSASLYGLIAGAQIDEDGELVWVQQSSTDRSSQFPNHMTIWFYLGDKPMYFDVRRNDTMTAALNPTIFRISKMLPTGLMTASNQQDFAFYHTAAELNDDTRANFVLHKPAADKNYNMYGNLKREGVVHLIAPAENNQHRIRRDAQSRKVNKRSVESVGPDGFALPTPGTTNIIEIGLWVAQDTVTHLAAVSGRSLGAGLESYIEKYANALVKDLDIVMKNTVRITNDIRVYLSFVAGISASGSQAWFNDNLNSGLLNGAAALPDFTTFIQAQQSALSLPTYDIAIALVRADIEDSIGGDSSIISVYSSDSLCTDGLASTAIAEVSTEFYLKAIGQAVMASAGVPVNSAQAFFLMSDDYSTIPSSGDASKPWNLKKTDQNLLDAYIQGLGANCLISQDASFDFQSFNSFDNYGKAFTADEQCELLVGSGASVCSTVNSTICYEGLVCQDTSSNCDIQLYVGQRTLCDTKTTCDSGECTFAEVYTTSTSTTPSTTSTLAASTEPQLASSTTAPDECTEEPVGRVIIDLTYVPCPGLK